VKLNLLVASSDKMVDDMRRGRVPTSTAKPLAASQTFYHTAGIMDTAITIARGINISEKFGPERKMVS
jgi:hypothetical protein